MGEGVRIHFLSLTASKESSLKWDCEPGEGHDRDQLRSAGTSVEELELSHKEVIGHLKSALQATGDVKAAEKMGKESNGVVGVLLDSLHHY